MIGGVLVGGWVVALCAWMAFGENEDTWAREGLKYLLMVVGFVSVALVIVWALAGFGYLQN